MNQEAGPLGELVQQEQDSHTKRGKARGERPERKTPRASSSRNPLLGSNLHQTGYELEHSPRNVGQDTESTHQRHQGVSSGRTNTKGERGSETSPNLSIIRLGQGSPRGRQAAQSRRPAGPRGSGGDLRTCSEGGAGQTTVGKNTSTTLTHPHTTHRLLCKLTDPTP